MDTATDAPDLVDVAELGDLVDGEAEAEADTLHTWARSNRGLPNVTGCGIMGPILPTGHRARRTRVAYRPTCPTCVHLGACEAEECETCAGASQARADVLAEVVSLVWGRRAVDVDQVPAEAEPVAEAPAPAPISAPGVTAETFPTEAGAVNGYRIATPAGELGPRALAGAVRRVLNQDRYLIGAAFTVSAPRGKGAPRSLVIVPDGPAPADWSPVLSRVRAALAGAVAGEVAEAGQSQTRTAEPIPF
jgi:hypothetical protein